MDIHATPISAAVRDKFADYVSPKQHDGVFRNAWQTTEMPGLSSVLKWKLRPNDQRPPGYRVRPLSVPQTALADYRALDSAQTRMCWIGHASFLVEMDRKRFVIDPIFGRAGGLVPRVTPAAFGAEALNELTAVLVTHGHHDHLDPAALTPLARANQGRAVFVVPTGLGSALPKECTPVVELAWWQYLDFDGVRVHLVPAQHWHRRGAFDMNKALWGGYVIEGTHRVYHAGDTGHFAGFEMIGEVFGRIDAACLPLGAYEPRWFMGPQHMSPESSLDALDALRARHFVGMHWGAYDLSDEPLAAGPALVYAEAERRGFDRERLHVLQPGGSLALTGSAAEARHVYTLE